jgi:hypothetical protein
MLLSWLLLDSASHTPRHAIRRLPGAPRLCRPPLLLLLLLLLQHPSGVQGQPSGLQGLHSILPPLLVLLVLLHLLTPRLWQPC